MYKLLIKKDVVFGVSYEKDGILYSIPFDPDNTDYQAFLKYQAEGGVVLPAEEA